MNDLEKTACKAIPINPNGFNPQAQIPYGLTTDHIQQAMNDFIDFLSFINTQLYTRQMPRLESFLMPANFSSIVGEFMTTSLPKYCPHLVKNNYHNGHPDLLPTGMYPDNAALHAEQGIEIKASRYQRGWQGHNPEETWLMVFVFEANSARDKVKEIPPKPFRFIKVIGAQLEKDDWRFSGRASGSRRTITASVTKTGYEKMESNWIYRVTPV
ncbi:MAG: hypothetical protein D6712_02965 [Chloroflexi bacterium]|nr:MAG: hypothetical protein D6712_02965 [Chloroflexota bacterium]